MPVPVIATSDLPVRRVFLALSLYFPSETSEKTIPKPAPSATIIHIPDIKLFESWLTKGLGRAAIFLQQNNAEPYLEALLHACLSNVSYDWQCEEPRTPYLWRLIQFTNQPAFFRNEILNHLTNPDIEEIDSAQVFGLAWPFAAAGDIEMRTAMYSAFEELGFENTGPTAAATFITLDGLQGFVFAASRFDADHPNNDFWEINSLVLDLGDKLGEKEIPELLAQAANDNPRVAEVLAARDQYNQQYKAKTTFRPVPDFADLKARPFENRWAEDLRRWANNPTPQQLELVAAQVALENELEKLRLYLRIFWRNHFPGSPAPLLQLADHHDKRVRWAAIRSLGKVPHPDVRAQALALLKTQDRFEEGARMLISNYQPGDFETLTNLLRGPITTDDFHGLGFAVTDIFDLNPTPEAEQALLLLYENNPCSNCREAFVSRLITLNKIPDRMRAECLYDANPNTIKDVLQATAPV